MKIADISKLIMVGTNIVDTLTQKHASPKLSLQSSQEHLSHDESGDTSSEIVVVKDTAGTTEVPVFERGSFDDGMQRLTDTLKNVQEQGFGDPQAVSEALAVLGSVANDTVKYVADQEVKQAEIMARRDVAIAKINAASELIKTYLEKTFDERSAIFAEQFKCVDEALRTGNNEMLGLSLNSINSLAASSPFKNLTDIGMVKESIVNSDTEWDI